MAAAAQPSLHLPKPGAQPGEWCHPHFIKAGLPTLRKGTQISLLVWGAVGYTHHSCNTSARVSTLTWPTGVIVYSIFHHRVRPLTILSPSSLHSAFLHQERGALYHIVYTFSLQSQSWPPTQHIHIWSSVHPVTVSFRSVWRSWWQILRL